MYAAIVFAGATKSSLLSAPSTVSMFVPAPEEFTDDQPTTMTDRYVNMFLVKILDAFRSVERIAVTGELQ